MDYYFIGYFVTATLLTTIPNMEKIFGGLDEFEFAGLVAALIITVVLSAIWPLSLPVIIGFLIKKIWNKNTKR
jgi:hypothetical protein